MSLEVVASTGVVDARLLRLLLDAVVRVERITVQTQTLLSLE
jgi:hypothetical protein